MNKQTKNKPEDFPSGNLQRTEVDGPCPNHNAARQRQNTRYVNDAQNWVTLCPGSAARSVDNWDEQWDEYYWSGRL